MKNVYSIMSNLQQKQLSFEINFQKVDTIYLSRDSR